MKLENVSHMDEKVIESIFFVEKLTSRWLEVRGTNEDWNTEKCSKGKPQIATPCISSLIAYRIRQWWQEMDLIWFDEFEYVASWMSPLPYVLPKML